jgi:WD40 repeat protein
VTQVGDRNDIHEKFHRYLETLALNPSHDSPSREQEQYVADQVALYAMARSGYAPHAYVDLWDRFQETHGKTGNWFSDLFGATKPTERRLREMLKDFSALPSGCADIQPASHNTELAQDEAGIHVLARDPLSQTFYIAAPDAHDAFFTPDSKAIAFHNRSLRVEIWSVADKKRTSAYEVTIPHVCLQTELSPDGLILSCLDEHFELSLIDVTSSKVLFSKKDFYHLGLINRFYFEVALIELRAGESPRFIRMRFSPDGRYFIAAFDETLIVDLNSRQQTSLPGSIRDLTREDFTFLSGDRILGIDPSSPNKSRLLRFPSGEHLDDIPLVRGVQLRGATHGDFVLVRPLQDYAAGAIDLKSKKVTVGVKNPALDIYDGRLIHERQDGELSLDIIDSKLHIAAFRLPEASLGSLRAAAASTDLAWLAVSGRSRGAVWNIPNNISSMRIRGFRGAWFGDDQMLYADMPKFEKTERQIGELVPATGAGSAGYQIGDARTEQRGRYLLVAKPRNKQGIYAVEDSDVEVRDVRDGRVLWSRYFPHGVPAFSFASDRALLTWRLSQPGAHDELQHFPELKDRANREDYLCEVVGLEKDNVLSRLVIKTNKTSFSLEYTLLAGDWIVAAASGNQVLAYSLTSGDEKASFFGTHPVLSASGGWLATDGEPGELKVYSLPSSQVRHQYVFPDPIAFKQFSADDKRLLVLTATQSVYILDMTANN